MSRSWMSVRIPELVWFAGGLVWLIVCSGLCLLPLDLDTAVPSPPWMDKLVHLLMFLGAGLWLGLRTELLAVLLLLAGFGGLIELLQGLTDWRSADILDWLADLLGAGLGWWLGVGLLRPAGVRV